MNLVKKEILGSQMYLMEDDPGISRNLILYGIREKGVVDILSRTVKPGMVVVDAGANIGYYTLYMSNLVGSEGKIYAVEPVPQNYEVLCKNAEQRDNIETFQLAFGNKNGKAKMQLSVNSNHGTMMAMTKASDFYKNRIERIGTEKVDVPVKTLDTFVTEMGIAPDLIRMDVEGYEMQIVGGMKKLLEEKSPKILMELHYSHFKNPETVDKMLIDLYKLGYRITSVAMRHGSKRVKASGFKLERERRECPNILLEKTGSKTLRVLADVPLNNVASGAEKAMLHLIDGLRGRGFDVEVSDKREGYEWADIILTQARNMPRASKFAKGKPIIYYMHNDYRPGSQKPTYRGLTEKNIALLIFNAEWVKTRVSWEGDRLKQCVQEYLLSPIPRRG